jgi:hypothetical protein
MKDKLKGFERNRLKPTTLNITWKDWGSILTGFEPSIELTCSVSLLVVAFDRFSE